MSNPHRRPYSYPPPPPFQPAPTFPPYHPQPPRKRLPSLILLSCLTLCIVAACALLALAGSLFSFLLPNHQPVSLLPTSTPIPPTLTPLKVYRVVGKPTMNAQMINDILSYYDSPASGKGQALYDYGLKYAINPAYAMAFFLEESNFGTKGVAVTTHALGNIRANTGEPQYKGFRSYRTWEQGFEDWYQLIAEKYVKEWHLTTVDHIVPVYAPAEDHNDQAQYIRTVKSAIERWRNGHIDL